MGALEVHAIKTWFDKRDGVVIVEDDVQNVVRDIRDIDPRLHIFWNPQSEEFDIVEHCLDGVQRLVMSVKELDQRVPKRIREMDHWGGNATPERFVLPDDQDALAKLEKHEEEWEEAQREDLHDKIGDVGTRLAWALDLVKDHHSVGGQIHVKKDLND